MQIDSSSGLSNNPSVAAAQVQHHPNPLDQRILSIAPGFQLSFKDIQLTGAFLTRLRKNQARYYQEVRKDPLDLAARCNLIINSLGLAYFFNHLKNIVDEDKQKTCETREKIFLDRAEIEGCRLHRFHPLHSQTYTMKAKIVEHAGIHYLQWKEIEEYIYALKTALALDMEGRESEIALNAAIVFIKKKWSELERRGMMQQEVHEDFLRRLDHLLSRQPIKELFIQNPSLFDLCNRKDCDQFFNHFPEYRSVELFLKKYPELESISFNDLSSNGLSQALKESLKSPYASKLFFISTRPILTPELADTLRQGMLNFLSQGKILKVYLGNMTDATSLALLLKEPFGREGRLVTERAEEFKKVVFVVYLS